ncbi:MAG: hypothetical protein HY264_06855, partial [Chloroflexi bacterium]|nr:hypothetical protein [Chloroflexota bacterium]
MTIRLDPWLAAVPARLVASLSTARDVLIVSHENPDADTLGAALGLREVLAAR